MNMEFLKYKTLEEVEQYCYKHAVKFFEHRDSLGIDVDSVEELAKLFVELYLDKAKQDSKTDKLIEYDDEIVSIEEYEEEETIDISVSKDSLFYANGILTKNSIGLPQTADFMFAITTDEVLQDNGQQLLHLLKTRWGNKSKIRPQLVNVNFDLMRYSDVSEVNTHVARSDEVKSKVGQRKPQTNEIDWS